MKDKSRFISSVIVSLLAGFIYYQFGQDINEDFQNSIKAVISSNDVEQYFPTDCQPFNSLVKKTDKNLKLRSKFFLKKKNTIEFKVKNETIPGDELFSEIVANNQAKFQRAVPDKNIDFTAELEHLIKNDLSKTESKQSKELKINKSGNVSNGIADVNNLKSGSSLIHKNFENSESNLGTEIYTGNGFEYNYMVNGNVYRYKYYYPEKTTAKTYEQKKTECRQFRMEYKKKTIIINGNKEKILIPKIQVKQNHKGCNTDPDDDSEENPEINNNDPSDDDTM